jgi:short subunit dehydrogenase-like uncharacterized protein
VDCGLRWALGGRSRAKLEAVRDGLSEETGVDASSLPLKVGDGLDPTFLQSLAQITRVVCTTVGPYCRYGSPLVEACARAGTDYCDLTGEAHWMAQMIQRHEGAARESGARIIHNCGFDCIPSDLGTFFVQREMNERHGVAAPRIHLGVVGFAGGASGGSVASGIAMMEDAARDRSHLHVMREPYSLNPEGERHGPDERERLGARYDPIFGQWTAPFIMATLNTKVVRRTNALLDYPYGRDFRYREATLVGKGSLSAVKAAASAAAMGAGMGAMTIGPLRRLLARRLPPPGQGPSKAQQERGFFDLLLIAEHPSEPAKRLEARVTGDRDPGYGSTSKMLAESAVCLARDEIPERGGFWTPASGLGPPLLERLQKSAGLTFSVLKD